MARFLRHPEVLLTLPWWAVFGVLRRSGVPLQLVGFLEAFYQSMQCQFSYRELDRQPWSAAYRLAQGCPVSQDLLNILSERFHRLAAVGDHGVELVHGCRIAFVNFADYLALVATKKASWRSLLASICAGVHCSGFVSPRCRHGATCLVRTPFWFLVFK